ncbi:hypothetical protein C0J52_13792 [Blattella germanica]|nr:hypothetical protein C0J52_13792 [Blattella germanica]
MTLQVEMCRQTDTKALCGRQHLITSDVTAKVDLCQSSSSLCVTEAPQVDNIERDSIVNLLECPVCMDTMRPPIFQCQNGHSICNKCKPGLTKCPTCRGALITTRNLLAEQLAYKVVYFCPNKDRGCFENVSLEDMKKHETSCPYRMYECLVGKDSGCAWVGRRSEILRHMEEKHSKYIYRSDLCSFKYEEFSFLQECKFSCIFSSCGEIFWYRSKRDPERRKLYEIVQYIGPKENASKYVYEHRMVSPDGDQRLTFSNVVRCDTDDFKKMCDTRKCFIIEYDTLEMFAQNGKTFEYQIKMARQK